MAMLSQNLRRALQESTFIVLIGFFLVGCQTTPNEGELARLEVYKVPLKRGDIHENQRVPEKLEKYQKEIREGRLVYITCGYPDAKSYGGVKDWEKLILLPKKGIALEGDVALIKPLVSGEPDGTVFDYSGKMESLEADIYLEYKYPGSNKILRSVRCEWQKNGIPIRAQLKNPVPEFELDYSMAERARHRQYSDEELADGRIGIGFCSLKDMFGDVYYQPSWLFKVPLGENIQEGDVVEVRLGAVEDGKGRAISQMTRKLGVKANFPRNEHTAIFCK